MPIRHQTLIRRSDLRENPEVLYVFGDNERRRGLGGQAKEMRGEPNAVGIPTKISPSMHPASFWDDDDFGRVRPMIDDAISRIERHLMKGGTVIMPEAGIGTGLANLSSTSPKIFAYITERIEILLTLFSED